MAACCTRYNGWDGRGPGRALLRRGASMLKSGPNWPVISHVVYAPAVDGQGSAGQGAAREAVEHKNWVACEWGLERKPKAIEAPPVHRCG